MTPLLIDPTAVDQWVASVTQKRDFQPPTGETRMGEFECGAMVAGSTAIIPIHGVIDYKPSMLSRWGYVCSSASVRKDFSSFVADSGISRIVFDIDSPGGLYSGTPELAKDIVAARGKKKIVAVANPSAASGALWIGAAAKEFFVIGSGQAGSLGALMLHTDMSQFYESNGITNTILRSPEGKADFNSLEPLSDESREHHQQLVEDIAKEFVASMAKMRDVSNSEARQRFGQGRMLNAEMAVQSGLVDGIVDSLDAVAETRIRSRQRKRLSPQLERVRSRAESDAQYDGGDLVVPGDPVGGTGTGVEGRWSRPSLSDFTDQEWSELSDAEKNRIARHFGWTDGSPPSKFEACKLPHHFYTGDNAGKPSLVATRNALARLNQTEGIPADERDRVRRHLRAHLEA